MKYAVVLYDGMADYPVFELGNKTPMQAAKKPMLDLIAKKSKVGLVKTVADGLKPGSDVANLSVLGYNPMECYTGRSPLEAASIGINLKDSDVTLRCNLVTLSEDEEYENKTIIDYCADDISTAEAKVLIDEIQKQLGNEQFKFYSGVSYRHCLVWDNGTTSLGKLTAPHDITGKQITNYLSDDKNAEPIIELMKKSYDILKDHEINKKRVENGKRPANSIWLWGEGKKPCLDDFYGKFKKRGAIISAVDLLKGIGKCAKMSVPEVQGATGYIDTNFEGKTTAAIKELENGCDFVYIHIEAPDECGHRHEIENKVLSIELIDEKVLTPLIEALDKYDDYKIMVLPDHPTPLETRTHASDPVPYLIYQKTKPQTGVDNFNEKSAQLAGNFEPVGYKLIEKFLSE